MAENLNEQKEALEVLSGFNSRLIDNMEIAIEELSGNRREDTDKLVKSITDAVNWEIQVLNSTMDLLNKDKMRIEKEAFNAAITEFANALQQGGDDTLAAALKTMLPQFKKLGSAVKEIGLS